MGFRNAILYRGFALDCEPVKKGDRCYVAQVIISRESGQVLDEYAFTDLCERDSIPSAAQYAKDWGRQWVDEHGIKPAPMHGYFVKEKHG